MPCENDHSPVEKRDFEAASQTQAGTCEDTLQPEGWHHWWSGLPSAHEGHQSTDLCGRPSPWHESHGVEARSLHRERGQEKGKGWDTHANPSSSERNPVRNSPHRWDDSLSESVTWRLWNGASFARRYTTDIREKWKAPQKPLSHMWPNCKTTATSIVIIVQLSSWQAAEGTFSSWASPYFCTWPPTSQNNLLNTFLPQ